MENNLIYNSVTCLSCGETLISRHIHDYKVCSCENQTMVDGGLDYHRSGGKDLNLVQSYCIDDSENFETLRFYIERGTRGINGDEPLHYVKLKDIDDEWLQNIIKYEEDLIILILNIIKKNKNTELKNEIKNRTFIYISSS